MYIVVSTVFMLFPANANRTKVFNTNDSVVPVNYISVTYGLAHTNILIDLSQASTQWHQLLPELVPNKEGLLLIGWGDRETYQSTPTWADLKVWVAFKALFVHTPSVLHVRYLPYSSSLLDPVISLEISAVMAKKIESNILNSFKDNVPVMLSSGYGNSDRFYYSKGSYHLFNTCNTWTGDVLRQSGVEISAWTPFSYNVIHSLRDNDNGSIINK